MKKIALVGGHLAPALAVIDVLPHDVAVLYIGRKYSFEGDTSLSLEYRTISQKKIPFAALTTGRLQRQLTLFTIPSLMKLPLGIAQAVLLLFKEKPDVVLSFGGYLSVPVGIACFLLQIPLVIHEQTQEAGIANKILSRFAKKILISWESSFVYFPKEKTLLTGIPLRTHTTENLETTLSDFLGNTDGAPLVFVTGGSGGSHAINMLVEQTLDRLLHLSRLIHQTGDAAEYSDFARLEQKKLLLSPNRRERYFPTKFISPGSMPALYEKADLVIARSGMNTAAELLHFQKPVLLIPLKTGQKNEQYKNALFLKGFGLCEVLEDESDHQKFLYLFEHMLSHVKHYRPAKEGRDPSINPKAASMIVDVLLCIMDEAQPKKKKKTGGHFD